MTPHLVIKKFLEFALEKYRTLESMTERVSISADHELVNSVLEKRETLLSAIEKKRVVLESEVKEWQVIATGSKECSTVQDAIMVCVESIRKFDLKISESLANSMESVRQELRGAFSSSRATAAYAAHSSSKR